MRPSRSQVVASILLAAVGLVLGDQIPAYLAARRLEEGRFWLETPSVEMRETAHAALGYWFVDPHEAVTVLLTEGDRSSVPYLEDVLESLEGDEVCTVDHAVRALERIEKGR